MNKTRFYRSSRPRYALWKTTRFVCLFVFPHYSNCVYVRQAVIMWPQMLPVCLSSPYQGQAGVCAGCFTPADGAVQRSAGPCWEDCLSAEITAGGRGAHQGWNLPSLHSKKRAAHTFIMLQMKSAALSHILGQITRRPMASPRPTPRCSSFSLMSVLHMLPLCIVFLWVTTKMFSSVCSCSL